MTALAERPAATRTPAHRRPAAPGIGWPLTVLAVLAVAAALRLVHVQTAYDVFIDEVSYSQLSSNVAAGRGVVLDGGPFDLHPPLLFLLFGGVLRLLGTDLAEPLAVVTALRPLEAVAGALSCALVVLLVARVAPRWVAVGAGLLLAVDPFVIRFDSRVMLEAPAMLLTLLGLLAVVRVLDRPARPTRGDLLGRVLPAALLLGLALLVKETFAFVAVAPLLLTALVLPRHRRPLLGVVAGAAGVYLVYLAVLLSVGRGGHWAGQKLSGVARLLGLEQVTGFNKPGSTSFAARLVELLSTYAVTYAVIGAATVVSALAALSYLRARRRGARPAPRPDVVLLVSTQLGAAAYLGYAVGFGTLEEQAFYLVVTPSVVVLGLAVAHLARRPSRPRVLPVLAAVVAVGVLAVDATAWWRVHTVRDDGYRQYVAWVETTLGPQDRVAVTDDTAQFITPGVVLGSWATPAAVVENRAGYVLVNQRLVDSGLGKADPAMVAWLDANATVVLDVRTPSVESLRVYEVDR